MTSNANNPRPLNIDAITALYDITAEGYIYRRKEHIDYARYQHPENKISEMPHYHRGRYAFVILPEFGAISVHRLVAYAFHGAPPEGKPYACHKDGDRRNNAAENLYWGDADDNAQDAQRHRQWRIFANFHRNKWDRNAAAPSPRGSTGPRNSTQGAG